MHTPIYMDFTMTLSYVIILIIFIFPLPSSVPFHFTESPFSSQLVTHLSLSSNSMGSICFQEHG